MKQYLVVVMDLEDKLYHLTWCRNKDDLVNLLANIDKDQYEVSEITVIAAIQENYREFCKKEPNLEEGV